jgi:hypothetical protein
MPRQQCQLKQMKKVKQNQIQSPPHFRGNLAQGAGLVTLATSQAPAMPGPRTKLRTGRTIEIIARIWESVVFREQLRVQCVETTNNLLMWGRYPHIDTSPTLPFAVFETRNTRLLR